MQSREFYAELGSLPKSFNWEVNDSNHIAANKTRGMGKGLIFNPLTAVANYMLRRSEKPTQTGTRRAAKHLGLTPEFADHVYAASHSANNRGNTQVVRGKIKSALGL